METVKEENSDQLVSQSSDEDRVSLLGESPQKKSINEDKENHVVVWDSFGDVKERMDSFRDEATIEDFKESPLLWFGDRAVNTTHGLLKVSFPSEPSFPVERGFTRRWAKKLPNQVTASRRKKRQNIELPSLPSLPIPQSTKYATKADFCFTVGKSAHRELSSPTTILPNFELKKSEGSKLESKLRSLKSLAVRLNARVQMEKDEGTKEAIKTLLGNIHKEEEKVRKRMLEDYDEMEECSVKENSAQSEQNFPPMKRHSPEKREESRGRSLDKEKAEDLWKIYQTLISEEEERSLERTNSGLEGEYIKAKSEVTSIISSIQTHLTIFCENSFKRSRREDRFPDFFGTNTLETKTDSAGCQLVTKTKNSGRTPERKPEFLAEKISKNVAPETKGTFFKKVVKKSGKMEPQTPDLMLPPQVCHDSHMSVDAHQSLTPKSTITLKTIPGQTEVPDIEKAKKRSKTPQLHYQGSSLYKGGSSDVKKPGVPRQILKRLTSSKSSDNYDKKLNLSSSKNSNKENSIVNNSISSTCSQSKAKGPFKSSASSNQLEKGNQFAASNCNFSAALLKGTSATISMLKKSKNINTTFGNGVIQASSIGIKNTSPSRAPDVNSISNPVAILRAIQKLNTTSGQGSVPKKTSPTNKDQNKPLFGNYREKLTEARSRSKQAQISKTQNKDRQVSNDKSYEERIKAAVSLKSKMIANSNKFKIEDCSKENTNNRPTADVSHNADSPLLDSKDRKPKRSLSISITAKPTDRSIDKEKDKPVQSRTKELEGLLAFTKQAQAEAEKNSVSNIARAMAITTKIKKGKELEGSNSFSELSRSSSKNILPKVGSKKSINGGIGSQSSGHRKGL
jgi:hypothetical protein